MAREAKKSKKAKAEKPEKVKKTKAAKSAKAEKPAKKGKAAKAEKPEKVKKTRRTKDEDEAPAKKGKKSAKADKPEKKSKKAKAEKAPRETKKSKREKAKAEATSKKKGKKSKSEDDDDEHDLPKGKGGKRKKLDAAVTKAMFNPYANSDEMADAIDKDLGMGGSSLNLDDDRMHSGSLVMDLVFGKGITAGWYTVFGPEQSCKSTGAMTVLIAAVQSSVPFLTYWDFEGSGAADYITHQLKTNKTGLSIEDVFGQRDPRTGKWIIKPRVRYHKPQVAEKFFNYLYKLMRRLPDKVNISGQWYYIYEDTKENRKIVGDLYDKNYWRATKMLRVEAPDGQLQAVAICDSYPAMLSDKLDDEDKNSGMAAQARMFAEQLKRVKGRMSAKRVAVIGINQLRQKPGVMYGSPDYEPCGDALKYFSDARLKFSARALSGVPYVNCKGQIYEEQSILGKKKRDEYRHIHIRGHKNKLGMPYVEGWLRLWIKDGNEEPRGFCPVWDTFMYLDSTNQVTHKSRSKIMLKIKKHENAKPMDWMDFKMLILGSKKQQKEICEKYGLKWFDLRAFCIKQMQDGEGMALYIEAKKSESEDSGKDDDGDEGQESYDEDDAD